jgi:hypothetical protein
MLTWPRQIPIGGNPADVVAIADAYARWMAENEIPKIVRERRAWSNSYRGNAGFLSYLEKSNGGHGRWDALHPGRLGREDWSGHCRMDENRAGLEATPKSPCAKKK